MGLLKEIQKGIRLFNHLLPYAAGDFVLCKVFQRDPRNRHERPVVLSMRIEAIIFIFQAMRQKPSSKTRSNLTKRNEFSRYYWKLFEYNKREPYEFCEDQREKITQAFNEIHSRLVKSLKVAGYHGPQRRFPTFASKLLHCSFPKAFPIRDTQSLNRMSSVAKRNGFCLSRNYLDHEYAGVVDFYLILGKKLERSYGSRVKEQLVEYDYSSQPVPESLKVRNTWLRAIDKWLWLKGQR